MVNGATSRIIYILAGIIAVTCIVAIVALKISDPASNVPNELDYALFGAVGFIVGAHVKPPIATDANGEPLAPGQKAA